MCWALPSTSIYCLPITTYLLGRAIVYHPLLFVPLLLIPILIRPLIGIALLLISSYSSPQHPHPIPHCPPPQIIMIRIDDMRGGGMTEGEDGT